MQSWEPAERVWIKATSLRGPNKGSTAACVRMWRATDHEGKTWLGATKEEAEACRARFHSTKSDGDSNHAYDDLHRVGDS